MSSSHSSPNWSMSVSFWSSFLTARQLSQASPKSSSSRLRWSTFGTSTQLSCRGTQRRWNKKSAKRKGGGTTVKPACLGSRLHRHRHHRRLQLHRCPRLPGQSLAPRGNYPEFKRIRKSEHLCGRSAWLERRLALLQFLSGQFSFSSGNSSMSTSGPHRWPLPAHPTAHWGGGSFVNVHSKITTKKLQCRDQNL